MSAQEHSWGEGRGSRLRGKQRVVLGGEGKQTAELGGLLYLSEHRMPVSLTLESARFCEGKV